ncbi:IS66 family transposase [Burkholderia gladioli]|uniref:Transposase IS66 n=1 Tax=Burkholderia gladioli (strain BSR3) TaxID=999541 RepID=F2LT43_BURGS|nr:IS66 family transposase [Burkholderia gladioli]AEA65919.1 transposase IS66 [Burkholderia gladioli BSR3]MBW5286843.1 IS66 family transposase [Burkholderia gladioli]
MDIPADLDSLSTEQIRALNAKLMVEIAEKERELQYRQTRIDQLTHELSIIKRQQFGKRSEQLNKEQLSLLEESVDGDLAAIGLELQELKSDQQARVPRQQPKRMPLPPELPRIDIRHEPDSPGCTCGCERVRIGEDISEKLDYTPGVFTVERHIRGKWVCEACDTLVQAPVPPHVIDKGIPTAGLLAQVLVAKYSDHLPLYRQERIFARAGLAIPRSTLGAWVGACGVHLQPLVDALRKEVLQQAVLHADETPMQMLAPGKGKTHRAYLWAYSTTQFSDLKAVIYDFADSRAGEHARAFLGEWRGKLVCDDYGGYKAGFESGITEIGCLAHARRKFFDLHVKHQSELAEPALRYFGALYEVERDVAELDPDRRRIVREERARPIADALHIWLREQRQRVPEGSATAKALDYSLKRWEALTRYLNDGHLPADNNWVENQVRPWAIGRSNWLFCGSLRAGKRAATIMTLIRSAQLNGHDPLTYLKDVLTRLPTHRAADVAQLLPHRWAPTVA